MIIDAHTHVGFGGAIVASADDLAASLRKNGIDKALVFAAAINECPTTRLLEEIAPHAGTLYGVGSVSPLEAGPDDLRLTEEALREGRIVALKFYPGYEWFYPADLCLRPYLELLAKHGRPAIFHSGDCYSKVRRAKLKYAQPIHLDELAVEMPGLKIVMAHIGNPWTIDAAEVCYKNENVFADCSGFVCGRFEPESRRRFIETIRRFLDYVETPEKLLFGSDWPIAEHCSYLEVLKDARLGRHLRDSELEKILDANAKNLFNL